MDSNKNSNQPSPGITNSTATADLSSWADEVIFGESEGSEDEGASPYLYKNGNVISRSKSCKRRNKNSPKANRNDSSSRQSERHIAIEMNHDGEENTDNLKNDADTQVDQENINRQNNHDFVKINTASGIHDDTTADWVDIDLNTDEDQTNEAPSSRPSSGARNNNKQIVFVQIGYTSDQYLITFLNILYYFGISPVKGDGKNPRGKWSFVLFFFVTTLAIVQAFKVLKIWILLGDPGNDIHVYYARLGYLTGILLLRLWFECLVAFKFEAIQKLIKAIMEFSVYASKRQILIVVLSPLLASFVISIGYPLLDNFTLFGWDLNELIPFCSYRLSQLLFLWRKPDEKIDDYLWDVYGTNITLTTMTMGATDLTITILGNFQQNLIRELCWLVVFTLYGLVYIFESDLRNLNADSESCFVIWGRYKALKKVSNNLNDAFGLLFQLFHLDNLFFCSYFVYEHIILGRNLNYACLQMFPLIEIFSFYGLAAKSSSVNSNFREWIHTNFCGANTLFVENGEVVGTINLLDDIASNPIGIEKNMFFINGSFLWKAGSVSGSYSFLFAQADGS